MNPLLARLSRIAIAPCLAVLLSACGGGGGGDGDDDGNTPPPAPETVTLSGVVSDGPVSGGAIFVFAADDVQAALDAAADAEDRHAALADAGPLVVLERDPADEGSFALDVPGEQAGAAVFLVFDNADAEDLEFRDTPPNLESVTVLGEVGATQRVNVTPHTTAIAAQVRARLPLEADAVTTTMDDAEANVLAALGTDDLGRLLFPDDASPLDSEDDALVNEASSALGLLVRSAAVATGASKGEVLAALAADADDGAIDGVIPPEMASDAELETLAASVSDLAGRGVDEDLDALAQGPCSSSAVALRRACDVETVDDLYVARAVCADMADEAARAACVEESAAAAEEADEECAGMLGARLGLCTELGDAAHEPAFGSAHAADFVNPLEIGTSVTVNPYFPLMPGNHWSYEGTSVDDEGETVTETSEVTVTDRTKRIDGIDCLVVHEVRSVDGVLIEDTEDWVAQDVAGNVWHCGELVQNFESFEGDDPAEPELVDIEGSWKAGREGAEAGMLFPAAPEVADVVRQEAAWGEAEDTTEITDLAGTEDSPAAFCSNGCLVTVDSSPLVPDAEENNYYVPGIGLIVETAEGERIELTQFSIGP
jgi:hypothetical protein